MKTRLSLSRTHYPVTSLGPGRRIGIWFQGCSIRCPGCCSLDTWSTAQGREVDIDDVLQWVRDVAADGCDGVTISGGEPFDQPHALYDLLCGLDHWRRSSIVDTDFLCYSGYPLHRLEREHGSILAKLDVLIPEPFRVGEPAAKWRGSANQTFVPFSELGRRRYTPNAAHEGEPPRVQIALDGRDVLMIGIPRRGDLERVATAAAQRGISLGKRSWMA